MFERTILVLYLEFKFEDLNSAYQIQTVVVDVKVTSDFIWNKGKSKNHREDTNGHIEWLSATAQAQLTSARET